jgi:PAS domain S-box-containing protein
MEENTGGSHKERANHASILIVEDEQIVAADIHSRLEALGYSVPAIAANGEEALAMAESLRPDLMLMDIVLEGPMDGVETVRQLRQRMDIPVIYLTAYTDEETVQRAKLTEPLGYILKPFDERELRFTIEVALHKHGIERGLREREEQFRQLTENSQEVFWMIDNGTREVLYVSQAYEQVWGRPPTELPRHIEGWFAEVHPDDRQQVQAGFEEIGSGLANERSDEYRIIRPDGTIRWILTYAFPVRNPLGKVYRIVGTSKDITQEKHTWEALRESEERYRLLADNVTDLISRHDTSGVYLYASPASKTLLGYAPQELIGQDGYALMHPDDARRIRKTDAGTHFLSSATESYRIRKPDGSYVWFETTAKTTRDASGRVVDIIAVSRDISDRKWAEGVLRRYEFIANSSREFMTLINRSYIYEAANDAYCRAHHRERSRIVGSTVADVWGEETFHTIIKGYLDECFSGKDVHYESWFEFGEEGSRFFDVNYYPYQNETGEVTHCVVVSHDITKRKTAEDLLHASLKEKEVLIKEIHHRVKNNLQVISSLLNLQSNSIDNKETRELVRESQNRVRSMALIHERLYQSENLARINLGEYLRNLTRDLFRSYGVGGITLKLEAEEIPLDVDSAIPCGLIVNELVSNALKYAFPGGKSGEVEVKFAELGRDKYVLSVSDNGTGLPPGFDIKTVKSLGLQLLNMLVRQLHGTLDVVSDGGTTFMITFSAGRALSTAL